MSDEQDLTAVEKAEFFSGELGIRWAILALVEATDRQAEQLKRIADILEYQMADTPRPDPLELKPLHTVSSPPSEMDNF